MVGNDHSRRLIKIVASVLIVGLSAACSSDGGVSEAPPDIGAVGVVTDASQISLPLDAYHMSVEEDLMLQQAEWELAVRCMARFGVQYEAPAQLYAGASVINHSRRYGLLDLESAQAWGYHGGDPAAQRERQADRLAEDRAREQSEAVEELLTGPLDPGAELPAGVPDGGCLGEARGTLVNGVEYNEGLVFDLAAQASFLAEQDGRVQGAFGAWSDCMEAAGFAYQSPWEANNDQWAEEEVTERERAVATADVRCKHETNLVGVWTAVDAAYQQRLIDRYAEQLTDLRQARAAVLANAAAVVSGT